MNPPSAPNCGWRVLSVTLAPALLLLWILYPWDALTGVDGAYHLRMGLDFPTLAARNDFPWLHWTRYREAFVNYHLGFHLLIWICTRPFIWCGTSPEFAGNMGVIAAAVCNGWAVGRVTRRYGPWGLTAAALLFLLLPWHFWLRHSYLRAFIVTSALLVLIVDETIEGRTARVFLLSWLCIFIYNISIVLAMCVPLAAAGPLLYGRFRSGGISLAAATAGCLAGILFHPHFPDSVAALWLQLTEIALPAPTDVGNEWKSVSGGYFLITAAPLLVLWTGALLLRLTRGPRFSARSTSLFLIHMAFMALTLRTRRTYEYWPLFALWHVVDLLHPHLSWAAAHGNRRTLTAGAWVMAAPALLFFHIWSSRITPRAIPPEMRGAHEWLQQHSPAGSLVLLDDWDEFSDAFLLNTHNHYPLGLDPMYTAVPYPEHWALFRDITRGKAEGRLQEIHQTLGCGYVLVRHGSKTLYNQLTASPQFEQVYPPPPPDHQTVHGRPGAALFRVLPANGVSATPGVPGTSSTPPSPKHHSLFPDDVENVEPVPAARIPLGPAAAQTSPP